MKRKSFIQMLAASALLSPIMSSGCSNSNEPQASNSEPESDSELSQTDTISNNQSLILTTATTSGTFYPVGVAIANVVSKEAPLRMNAIDSAGSAENIQLLKNNEADLAILQSLFAEMAWSGAGQYQDRPERGFRSITSLWPNVEHFIVYREFIETGNVEDIANMKGKTFSVGKRGSGTEISSRTILGELGFNVDEDFIVENLGYSEGAEAMQNGRLEAMTVPVAPPVPAIAQLYASMGKEKIAILEFTEEQLKKINATFPVWVPYTIEANAYPNQPEPIKTIAQPNCLVVRSDIDDETVYQTTKTIYENLPALQEFHHATKEMRLISSMSGLTVPLHQGAMQYYQEQELTIPEGLSTVRSEFRICFMPKITNA
ncbi:TRAP-type transport system, substrate-binding protein [Hyella patelloides LEGE 07179]|uniref:TRAP-type transport system, substrate-binding protein n=1 Tax=Hyella patelloides LEGE 07179 TaxID=945734 RepID=A0A563W3S9_9CYAN|nr:TAXI family TRAP transporter solute-binding subunit [Hyella patelloides]VEP18315.1 TRAP-type transport system, substrate-binding protein [Hyella patelloides LEGE 07179]